MIFEPIDRIVVMDFNRASSACHIKSHGLNYSKILVLLPV
jgi:hypothetical protein